MCVCGLDVSQSTVAYIWHQRFCVDVILSCLAMPACKLTDSRSDSIDSNREPSSCEANVAAVMIESWTCCCIKEISGNVVTAGGAVSLPALNVRRSRCCTL